MMVFQSQFEAVESPTPRERMGSGKTSGASASTASQLKLVALTLANDHPRSWTPRGGKESDRQADESDLGACRRAIARVCGCSHDAAEKSVRYKHRFRGIVRDYILATQHAQSAVDQNRATAEAFDRPEGDWCGADVDQSGDQANEEGVIDRAELLEEGCAEIEDLVIFSDESSCSESGTMSGLTKFTPVHCCII